MLASAVASAAPIADEFDADLGGVLGLSADAARGGSGVEQLRAAVAGFRAGRFDDALAQFEKARAADAALRPAKLMLARLVLATGRAADGRRLLERVAAEPPVVPAVYLQFGELALADGRFSDAGLNFEQAAALAGDRPLAGRDAARLASGRAAVAEARGDWPSAGRLLAAWLKNGPTAAAARLRLARTLVRQQKPDAALATLVAAPAEPSRPPGSPAAEVTVGRLLDDAGDREAAAAWMARAAKDHPRDAATQVAVGVWHLERGEPGPARQRLAAARALDPKSTGLDRADARAALLAGDLPAAERVLETLHQASPADADAADGLARALLGQKDAAKRARALELATVNARQYPNSPPALATLGRAYLDLGRTDEAARALAAAVSNGAASSETAFDLARVRVVQGRPDDARGLVEQALAATGPFPRRKEAEAWLKTLPPPEKVREPDK